MELRDQLRQCLYELSEDSRLVRAGLSDTPHSEEILAKYPDLAKQETVLTAKEAFLSATDPIDRECKRRVFYMAVSFYLEHFSAGISDQQDSFYAKATADIDGEPCSYFDLPLRVQKEENYEKREHINAKRLEIVKEGTKFSQEMLETTLREITETLGYASYISYCSEKKQMDYAGFLQILDDLYTQVHGLYETHMGRWVNERFGKSLGDIPKVHASVLINLSRFDQHIAHIPFKEKMYDVFASMGLPFTDFPNIQVDLEDRPAKNPRACCYSAVVPEEIHVLLKPSGKMTDFETFLHETGHAMHYGSTDTTLPVEMKEFGPSYALTETYAFLFEKLMFDEGFLMEHFGFDATLAKEVSYYHTLANLWFLVRYIGKFRYEYAFFNREKIDYSGTLYASTLTETTGFLYDDASYLEDMDGEFYSADYLRAWIAERQLHHYLVQHFGTRWYANPEASTFIKKLWAKGDSMSCEEMVAQELGMNPFDISFLVASYQGPLTS